MRSFFVANVLGAVALVLGGCGADPHAAGRAVSFSIVAESVPSGQGAPGTFVTRTGWTVTLEEAAVAVGPLYLHADPPPSARRGLSDWLIARAWAHSGFDDFDGGEVRGEYLGSFLVDALAPGLQPIASTRGSAGRIRSATLELQPPSSPPALLHGHQAWVRGVAVRETETIPFEGGLDLPATGSVRKVVGIPADIELDDGTKVVLELHLERWFAEADFAALPAGEADDERRVIVRGTQPYDAWFLGARAFGTFTLRGETR